MSSIFDEERKRLGLSRGGWSSSPASTASIFDGDRMDLGLKEDTRPTKKKPQTTLPSTFGNIPEFKPQPIAPKVPIAKKDLKGTVKNSDSSAQDAFKTKPIDSRLLPSNNTVRASGPKAPSTGNDKLDSLLLSGIGSPIVAGFDQLQHGMQTAVNFQQQPTNQVPSTGSHGLDSFLRDTGEFLTGFGSGAPSVGNLASGTSKGVQQVGANLGPRLTSAAFKASPEAAYAMQKAAPIASKIAGHAIGAGVENAALGAAAGQTDTHQVAENFGYGAALGAAGSGLKEGAKGVGRYIRKIAQESTESNPVFKSLLSEIGESGARAEIGKRNLADIDEQIQSVSKGNAPDKAGQYKALFNERNAVVDYIKQHDPEFEAPKPRVTAGKDAGILTKVAEAAPPKTPLADVVAPKSQPSKPDLKLVPPINSDELKFASTVRQSEKTSPELAQRLTDNPLTGARTTDKLNQQVAKQLIENHGIDGLSSKLLAKKGKLSPSEVTAAQMLARHFSESGDLDRAIEVVSKTAREGREMGQAIQALSQWNKLDQEGALLLAERQLNRGTSNTEEWVKLTPEQAKPVQTAAKKIEQVQSARSLADEVVKMIANKPAGEALTDSEKLLISDFQRQVKQVNEQVKPFIKQPKSAARQKVIDEVTKVPPKERTRDQVVNLLDAKAAKARERLNRARNIGFAAVNKGNPAIDYSIIGASHLAKGAVRFADFSEKLIRDYGDSVRPYLHEAYTRATRTFRKENGLPTETELNRVINTAIKKNKLDKDTSYALKSMASEIGFYLDANLKKEATQDLQLVMRSLGDSTLGNKLASVQSSAMLLNAQTFLRNLGGTAQMLITEKITKMAAVPIDWAFSKFTGERTIKFFPKNQSQLFKDYMTGTVSGYKGVSPSGSLTSHDVYPESFKSDKNPLKWLSKLTGASIQGMDYAAYQKAAGEVLATFAEQRGLAQGLSSKEIKEQMPELIKNLEQSIYDLADQAGTYSTFQDETFLSRGAQRVKQGLNKPTDSLFKSLEEMGLPKWMSLRGFGAGDILVKFARTPANLVMRGLDYSPIGFIRGVYHLIPLLTKSGKFNQYNATRYLSKAIIGSIGFTGLGFVMADAGILTGAASSDKDMRSIQEQSGQGAYKVNWSAMRRWLMSGFDKSAAKYQKGDHMMDYAWLQPAAISVAMGVNANMAWKDRKAGDDKTLYQMAFQSLAGGLRTIMENPMVTGLSSVVDATQDLITKQDGTKLKGILKGVPASFVPTLSNQLRTSVDNQQRETFDQNALKEMLNLVKNKIPWWSKSLPASYNSLGKEREKLQGGEANTLGQYLNAFINPTKSTSFEVTPEAKMVLDVLEESGDETILPRIGTRYIMVDDPDTKKQKRLDLTAEQFSRLQHSMGQMTVEKLDKVSNYLASPTVPIDKKAKKIKDILTSVGQKARNEIRVEQGYKKKKEN